MLKKFIAVCCAIIFLLCGCTPSQNGEEMPVNADLSRSCVVYFANDDVLVPVSVQAAWSETTLDDLYQKMCLSSEALSGTGLTSVMPEGTSVTTIVEDKTATVEINAPNVESLTQTQAENIVTATVNTATQFGGIEGVTLVFNGQTERIGGVDISECLAEQCINPAYDIGDLTPFEVYYELTDTDYVIPVTKAARDTSAEVQVNAMMKVPEGMGCRSLFPEGTKLLSVSLDNGVLSLNFSKELSALSSDEKKLDRLLCALNAMLSGLEGVTEVKVLCEGTALETEKAAASVFANEVFLGL